ncbi:hypothetical protein CLU83_3235 [Flavobacterium sp. 1]|nr:hypothetical protein CLU83_3235 [Flavobacterium sp. 1]
MSFCLVANILAIVDIDEILIVKKINYLISKSFTKCLNAG